MFQWLKNLFLKESSSKEDSNVYSPVERVIYSYFDGEKIVKADPLVLYRKVHDIGALLDIDMKVARSISKDATKAHDAMLEKMRSIFDVQKWNGEKGLTEAETENLFWHFFDFCETVKKNSRSIPINATVVLPSTPLSSNENLPIPPSSVSGSTEDVSNADVPNPSPSESVSH